MVSRANAKYYKGRLAEINVKRRAAIKEKYPEVAISYKELIGAGAGRLRSEEEIRRACSSGWRNACPPMVEILDIFDLNGERKEAENVAAQVGRLRTAAFALLDDELKRADDLLHFGTDEQLLARLNELEARAG